MAQIKIKRSSVEGKIPLTTDVELGELAINTYDGKLFLKRSNGLQDFIVEVGGQQGFEVKNQTGSTITKGTCVRFAGTLGSSGKLLVAPFLADGTYPSEYFMGVAVEDILNGSEGFVTDHGKILGLNTSAYPDGTILYASSTVAGGFSSTQPEAPNNKIIVAAVIYSHPTAGSLQVRITLGSQLHNDEFVELDSLQNGDILSYNSTTSRFENTQPAAFTESDTLDSVTTRNNTTTNSITVGNLTHSGLVASSGTNIDQILTFTKTITLTQDWQDVGIYGADLATGSYILQLFASDIGSGGTNLNEYYTGNMSWYSGTTNSSSELPTDEIVLHRAGASGDGALYLRTYRNTGGNNLSLQIYSNTANVSASNYVFKFRRII